MRKSILLIALFFVCICISCKRADYKEYCEIIHVETKGVKEKINISLIAEKPKIVKLYTDSLFLVGDIRQIKFAQKIYIQNFQKILVFNMDGSPAYVINNSGKSGEEYYEINDFYVDTLNNKLEVWDRVKRQMLFYNNQDGSFIKLVKFDIDAAYFKKIKQNYFFYSSEDYSKDGEETGRILCVNNQGEVISEFLKSNYARLYSFSTPYFLSVVNDELFFDAAPLNTIYKITENECIPIYKTNIDNNSLSVNGFMELKELRASERFKKMVNTCSFSTGNSNIWEGGVYLEIRSHGNWYPCFYYPASGKTVVGTGFFDDYFLHMEVYSYMSNDNIIYYWSSYKMLKYLKDSSALKESSPEVLQMLKQLDTYDNPVLFISDLKKM